MDEVFADLNISKVLLHSLWYFTRNPRTLYTLFSTDLWGKFKASGKASFSAESLGDLAKDYPALPYDFDQLMYICHGQRLPCQPVIDLLIQLKDQGYVLVVATNRDRMAFEITAQSLGLNTLHKGGPLFDHVITARHADYKTATTNKEGKRFSKLRFHLPNDYVTEVKGFKPGLFYYQKMRTCVDALFIKKGLATSPKIIFFDDNTSNIIHANATDLNITGFLVPSTKRAEAIAKDLAIIGIKLPPKSTSWDMLYKHFQNLFQYQS